MKIIKIIITIAVVLLTSFFLLKLYNQKRMESSGLILKNKIEEFQKTNGYLPNDMSDINELNDEGNGPFYEKLDSQSLATIISR